MLIKLKINPTIHPVRYHPERNHPVIRYQAKIILPIRHHPLRYHNRYQYYFFFISKPKSIINLFI